MQTDINEESMFQKVESVLQESPDTRNNDKLLVWKIWEIYYQVKDSVTLNQFIKLPSEEIISRIRRRIQNDLKLYPPTDQRVAEARKWNMREWMKLLGYNVADIPDDDETRGQLVMFKGENGAKTQETQGQ